MVPRTVVFGVVVFCVDGFAALDVLCLLCLFRSFVRCALLVCPLVGLLIRIGSCVGLFRFCVFVCLFVSSLFV